VTTRSASLQRLATLTAAVKEFERRALMLGLGAHFPHRLFGLIANKLRACHRTRAFRRLMARFEGSLNLVIQKN
jgi:hypothetical protein